MICEIRLVGVIMFIGYNGVGICWFLTMFQFHDYELPLFAGLAWCALGIATGILTAIDAIHNHVHKQWWNRICSQSRMRYKKHHS